MNWIAQNLGNIIVILILAVMVAGIVYVMLRNRKEGKNSCGCKCSSCPMSGKCGKK